MNYNQFYRKRSRVKRKRGEHERRNALKITAVFIVFTLLGMAAGGAAILFFILN